MSNFVTPIIRWSITSALMLSAIASTGLAQASDTDTHAAAVPNSSTNASTVQATGVTAKPDLGMGCTSSVPCVVSRTSDGWELDYGGPSLYFDRISDE